MSILQNAVDSIQLGIEDYELIQSNPKRLVSCTRNLFAGILLLFKYHLFELSGEENNEVLIKKNILPKFDKDGKIVFVGVGKNTIDVQGIQQRFESLNINVNWKELDKIQKYRNNIEHYFSHENSKTIESILAHSFNVINDFVRKYLKLEPSELIGKNYWKKLLEVQIVYQVEKDLCLEGINSNKYFNLKQKELLKDVTCKNCGYDLIKPLDLDIEANYTLYQCLSCSQDIEYEILIRDAISQDNDRNYDYNYYKDGGEEPYTVCPECNEDTYSIFENICMCCGHEVNNECYRCGNSLSGSEVSYLDGICSYCQSQWGRMQKE